MIEIQGDIWQQQGDWLCITTNGMIRSDGKAVMGRGIALEAKQLCPNIDLVLAQKLKQSGNIVSVLTKYQGKWIISFPTKLDWRQSSDIELIKDSARQLKRHFDNQRVKPIVLLPRPGCGNGNLDWNTVKAELGLILTDDNFQIVSRG